MADLAGVNGQRTEFKVVGKPNLPGPLSYAMATGMAKYGVDHVLPNMLHAKFLRSPYAHARIISVDTSKARALEGVVDILTWEDEDIKKLVSYGEHWGTPRPWLDNIADQEGDEVGVIVVAESEDICEEALRLLDVKWEILPHVVNILEGRKEDAPVIRPEDQSATQFGSRPDPNAPPPPPKKGNVSFSIVCSGDIEEGFRQADHIVEFELYLPAFASHFPNPSGSVAWWDKDPYKGDEEVLHIEGAVRERLPISKMYNIPLENVVQESLFMGGKYCDWGLRRCQEITPLLAKRTGRPVRCVNTRYDTYDFSMKQRFIKVKVGFTKEGLITAIDDYSVADGGVRGSSTFGTVGDLQHGPYNSIKCPNIRQQMEIVDSNRGMMYVSGQHCPFNWDIITVANYLIAEKLGKDPIEVARLNLHGPTAKEDPNPVPSFERCVEEGKKLMNWQWHPARTKRLPDGRWHGMSFRYQMSPRHSVSGYICKLEFRDGVVYMPTQGPVFGAYMVEAVAMVVAEELGIPYEDLKIVYDYREKFSPVGGGADGSTASAWAMKECANLLKQEILKAAIEYAESMPNFFFMPLNSDPPPQPGPFKGLKPEDLDIKDGMIYVKADPSKAVPLKNATPKPLVATYQGRPPLAAWLTGGGGKQLDCMNALFCEVAVDEETGEVEILRFGAAVDAGKVLRPISLESQVHQNLYFTQGCQLFEDFIYDERTGVRLNNNMIDYKKVTMLDVPEIDTQFIESRAGNAAYGASGISHSLANTHLVITAIHNAIGVWVDPPATPDKVLRALGKA